METRLPEAGERIRYKTRTARTGQLENYEGEGVVVVVWSNGWDGPIISVDNGPAVVASLGDSWEIIDG